jgi:WD40 repeat protein
LTVATQAPEHPASEPAGAGGLDAFVSYSRRDQSFVIGLTEALERRGRNVWIDADDIPPGAPWRRELGTGIEAADAFVFVISPDSVASKECADELRRATGLGKRLVPVLYREAPIPDALAAVQYIDIEKDADLEQSVERLDQAIETDHDWAREHTQWLARALRWDEGGRDRSRLLRGAELDAAERWLARQAEGKKPPPTRLQTDYIVFGRHAERRRLRTIVVWALLAVAVSLGLGVLALLSRNEAIRQRDEARSRELAASALSVLDRDPELSVLLGARAARLEPTAEAEDVLRRALTASHVDLTLRGHNGPLRSAAMDDRGAVVGTAGEDGTARVWDARTGRALATLRNHSGPVLGVAVRPDARTVVTTGADRTARLWDSANGRQLAVLRGHDAEVYGPSFSADGRLVATASADGTARVWDGRTGRPRAVLRGHGDLVFSARIDPAARRVVTSSADGTARIWRIRTGSPVAVLDGHRGWVNRAVFSPDGRLVATAAADNQARIWDAASGRLRAVLRGHSDDVRSVAFSPDGRKLVTASSDATAAVWDVASGRHLAQLRGHLDVVGRALFSPDGTQVLTAAADDTARLWDARTGEPIADLRGHTDEVHSPAFTADGARILTAADDGTARLWNSPMGRSRVLVREGEELLGARFSPDGRRVITWSEAGRARVARLDATHDPLELRGDDVLVQAASFSPDGRRVVAATAGVQEAARVWELRTGGPVRTMRASASGREFDISRDGPRFVTVSVDGLSVRIWSARTGQLLARLREAAPITGVAMSPDGRRVIATRADSIVTSWDVDSGRPLARLRHHAGWLSPGASFAPDGERAVLTSLHGSVPVWNLRRDAPSLQLRPRALIPREVVAVEFSPDGRLVAVADRSTPPTARVFDAATGDMHAQLRGHVDELRSVAFSPNGRWVLTASLDRTARVWEAATGRPVAEFRGNRRALVDASFSPDGNHVLTAGADGTARLYACQACGSLDRLLAAVPDHVSRGRRLSVSERREFLPF